jgi:hypothetical protein
MSGSGWLELLLPEGKVLVGLSSTVEELGSGVAALRQLADVQRVWPCLDKSLLDDGYSMSDTHWTVSPAMVDQSLPAEILLPSSRLTIPRHSASGRGQVRRGTNQSQAAEYDNALACGQKAVALLGIISAWAPRPCSSIWSELQEAIGE